MPWSLTLWKDSSGSSGPREIYRHPFTPALHAATRKHGLAYNFLENFQHCDIPISGRFSSLKHLHEIKIVTHSCVRRKLDRIRNAAELIYAKQAETAFFSSRFNSSTCLHASLSHSWQQHNEWSADMVYYAGYTKGISVDSRKLRTCVAVSDSSSGSPASFRCCATASRTATAATATAATARIGRKVICETLWYVYGSLVFAGNLDLPLRLLPVVDVRRATSWLANQS